MLQRGKLPLIASLLLRAAYSPHTRYITRWLAFNNHFGSILLKEAKMLRHICGKASLALRVLEVPNKYSAVVCIGINEVITYEPETFEKNSMVPKAVWTILNFTSRCTEI